MNRFDFPEGIRRVTASIGGESLLILGSEKTVVYDCGMAFSGDELVKNIETELAGRTLDYVLLSHTHYDHIGGLSYIKKRWPDAIVCGAEYAKHIFERPGAIVRIKSLSESARDELSDSKEDILVENLRVDRVLKEGDTINIGSESIVTLETPGHTDCSLTFVIEPRGIMLASETTGALESSDYIHVAVLKSYQESLSSCEKCKNYGIKYLISPHYGYVAPKKINDYWKMFKQRVEEERSFVEALYKEKFTKEAILEKFIKKYFNAIGSGQQPKEAFIANAVNVIDVAIKELR